MSPSLLVPSCIAYCISTPLHCAAAVAKSAFGLYTLYRAVKAGRTVIYASLKGGMAVFKGGKAYMVRAEDLVILPEMGDPNALYISDSLPPVPHVAAFRLLITSPKKGNWSKFVQSPNVSELVLPIFTKEETLALRDAAFSDQPLCSTEEVEARFKQWGGSARSVLTHANKAAKLERLTSVAGSLSMAIVEKAMQGMRALDGVSDDENVHRLLDIVPRGTALPEEKRATSDEDYYRFHHAQLITEHVVGLFADNLLKREAAELYRFLHKAASDPAAATLRGKLYERCIVVPRFVHGSAMGSKGELLFQRLSPELSVCQPTWLQTSHLMFQEGLPLVHFHSLKELAGQWAADTKDAIFVPFSKETPIIDFVLRYGGQALLANATVGESHDIKLSNRTFWVELLRAVGLGNTEQEVPLVWVLDKPAYDHFNESGRMISESNNVLVQGPTAQHVIGQRLAQYKLLLEVPSVRSE